MANEEHLSILRQGIEVWNKWREQNPEILPDLEKADLRKANLRGVNLGRANLERADLMQANLRGSHLERASLRGAYLRGAKLNGASLRRANLIEANLARADLERANLGKSDLGKANLENANLRRADLERANLEGANLDGANLEESKLLTAQVLRANLENTVLTGACILDWNISADTNFEGVVCEYIFLSWDGHSGKPKERRPHSGTFTPGEFTKLFQLQNVLKTAEIFFPEGIDWQAFLKSLQKLQAKVNSGDLSIQAIEKKAGEAFVVRLEVPADADKGRIEEEIKKEYEFERKLLEVEYRGELNARDREIERHRQENANLLNIIKWQTQRPITVEAKAVVGDTYNQSGVGIGHMSGGEIKDRVEVTGNLSETPESLKEESG